VTSENLPVATGAAASPKRRYQARRQATENAIIDAFERLLTREGVGGLGVNALIKEAGVGKKQVYDYFGGLSGVAERWVRERGVWPGIDTIIEESMATFSARTTADKCLVLNEKYAAFLRKTPRLCELLTGEFVKSTEVKQAVEHIRQLIRVDFERMWATDPRLMQPDFLAMSTVAYSAATYLALRAHQQPNFFGFNLATEASWQIVMQMFERVLTLADPDRIGKAEHGNTAL
jgi:AcrR family transcriptional regulator